MLHQTTECNSLSSNVRLVGEYLCGFIKPFISIVSGFTDSQK